MASSQFSTLGLAASITQVLTERGYETPTPVQKQAIPAILAGRDVLAAAQTGTGKTAGFVCPVLQGLLAGETAGPNQVRALILAPTRELALQIGSSVKAYGQHLPLRSTVVYGGVKINPQMMLLRRGIDLLVATPGRLLDLAAQNALRFDALEVLVLDEADRMLDLGFSRELEQILRQLPQQRQNLMFTATFPEGVRRLAKTLVQNPVEIIISPEQTTARTVKQWAYTVDKKQKPALLVQLMRDHQWQQILVFTKTKAGADQLTRYLHTKGVSAAAIHGDRSQGQRMEALGAFKKGEFQVLVATDVAARGLDIQQLPQVVNFDLPKVAENYVHRIGRTGRAGLTGEAVSLVSADEIEELKGIERLIQQILPREVHEDFYPDHQVPASSAVPGSIKPKKPKKPQKPKKPYQAPTAARPRTSGAVPQRNTAAGAAKKRRAPTRKGSKPGSRQGPSAGR